MKEFSTMYTEDTVSLFSSNCIVSETVEQYQRNATTRKKTTEMRARAQTIIQCSVPLDPNSDGPTNLSQVL